MGAAVECLRSGTIIYWHAQTYMWTGRVNICIEQNWVNCLLCSSMKLEFVTAGFGG